MKTISKIIAKLLLTFTIAAFVAASPALAEMGGGSGGGMGGSSDSDSGNRMGGKSYDDRTMAVDQNQDLRSMPAISTGSLGSGDMTMEIEPVMFGNGRLEVKYDANTHTLGLGKYDLMELSTMEVDGKVYHPVEADRMSGHHAGGKIVFEIPERPDRFRMVIQGLPGVEKRLYEWN